MATENGGGRRTPKMASSNDINVNIVDSPQRCELKINKLKIKTSINIESCVDCNYNIGIKNGSCEIGATSRYKICVSRSSGCGFWSRFRWTVLAISAFESWYLGLLILVLSIVGSYFVVLHLICFCEYLSLFWLILLKMLSTYYIVLQATQLQPYRLMDLLFCLIAISSQLWLFLTLDIYTEEY